MWVNGPGGRLVPASSRSRSIPVRPAAGATPRAATRGTRVLMLVAYGDAAARSIGSRLPETIAPGAFGPADELNRDRAFDLRCGHRGPRLTVAGPRLRAIDTPAGLVVEWRPDDRLGWDRDAVRSIEAGHNGVSVALKIADQRLARLPQLVNLVTRARLEHIALLLDGEEPAYPGAMARVFRFAALDDEAELRRHIDKLVSAARFKAARSRRPR